MASTDERWSTSSREIPLGVTGKGQPLTIPTYHTEAIITQTPKQEITRSPIEGTTKPDVATQSQINQPNPNPTPKADVAGYEQARIKEAQRPMGYGLYQNIPSSQNVQTYSRRELGVLSPVAQFGFGVIRGGAGIIDLATEATIKGNPLKAIGSIYTGTLAIPEQFVKDPFGTSGELTGAYVVGGGRFGKEAPKVYDVNKVSLPTEFELTRKAVVQRNAADLAPSIQVSKTGRFVNTQEYVLKNPNVEVRGYAEGPFKQTIEATNLFETRSRLGGSIKTVESAGLATITEGNIKGTEVPRPPYGDISGMARSFSKNLEPQTIFLKEAKSPLQFDTGALVPKGYKDLSTETATQAGLKDLSIQLFPKERATISDISIPKVEPSLSKGISIFADPKTFEGLVLKEKTLIDIRPRVINEPPKIYNPRYFDREGPLPKYKPSARLYPMAMKERFGTKSLSPYFEKMEGYSPGRKALPGSVTNWMTSKPSFKRVRPFSYPEPKGGITETGSSIFGRGSGGSVVQQIYKSRQRQIPKADVIAKTIVEVPKSRVTTVQEILQKQNELFARRSKGRVAESEFNYYRYPTKTSSSLMPSMMFKDLDKDASKVSLGFAVVQRNQTKTIDRQLDKQLPSSGFGFVPYSVTRIRSADTTATITRQIQPQPYVDKQATAQMQRQIEIPKTRLEDLTLPRFGGNDKLTGPKEFFVLPGENKKRRVDEFKFTRGFDVFLRRRGKFIKVSQAPLSKQEAIGLGAFKAEQTLGATFKIKEAAGQVMNAALSVPHNMGKFYPKVEKGEEVFIQKAKFRLGTGMERKEIKAAKIGWTTWY